MIGSNEGRIRAIERREMAASAVINALLSIAFTLLVFGWPETLAFWVPDRFVWDFFPQFAAVSLMSALVPAFIARKKLAAVGGRDVAPAREIITRAVGLCLCALLAAGAIVGIVRLAGWTQIAGTDALWLKAISGAVLGSAMAWLALRPLSRGGRSAISSNPS